MRPPRNRIIRTPIPSDPSEKFDTSDRLVTVRVGKQPIHESGEYRPPGTEFEIPATRARALASLVTIL